MSLPTPTTATAAAGPGNSWVNMDPRQLADMEAPMIALAQASGGDIRKLLYGFFSFLHRRTDFYVVQPTPPAPTEGASISSPTPPQSSMGFKEGDAEKLLIASFRQFPLRRVAPRRPPAQTQAPPPTAAGAPASSSSSVTSSSTRNEQSIKSDSASKKANRDEANSPADAAVAPTSTKSTNQSVVVRYTEEGLQVPVGNGGSTPAYEWTQTIDECTVMIGPLPTHCQRARDLSVDITPTTLSVRPKKKTSSSSSDQTSADGALVLGTLTERVVPSESTWTIEGGVLVVLLHKAIPTFWKAIMVGDEEIDTTLVDSRRHIDEYDAETQAKLRKIMFDEQQLRRGLPTSDEILGVAPPPLPTIPTLPPGVEYINRSVLDQNDKAKVDPPP